MSTITDELLKSEQISPDNGEVETIVVDPAASAETVDPPLVERDPTMEEKLWYCVDDYLPVAGNVKFRIVYNQERDLKSVVNDEYSLPATSRDAMLPVLAEFLERLNGEEKELVLKDLPDPRLLWAEAKKNKDAAERLEEGEKDEMDEDDEKEEKEEKEEEEEEEEEQFEDSEPELDALELQLTEENSQSSYIMGRVISGLVNKQDYLSLSIPPEVYRKHEREALIEYIKDQKLEISPEESFSLAPVRFFENGMIALYKIEVISEYYTVIPQIVHKIFDAHGSVLDFSYVSYTNKFLIDSPTVDVYVLAYVHGRSIPQSFQVVNKRRRSIWVPIHLLKQVLIRGTMESRVMVA